MRTRPRLELPTRRRFPPVNCFAPGDAGTVSVFLGNGNGTFGSPTNLTTGTNANSVAIGDLNGDGKLDLAVANAGSNTVSVFLGNGN
jgi:hypothetical protein